jgi:alkylhydroperoxidase/carboxymuconolactone decarboxylase family protein YurZ
MKSLLKLFLFLPLFIIADEGVASSEFEALDKKEQATITISAFTASGDMDRLKVALEDGLDAGLTINEIKEMIAHLYAYVGFPRSLNSQNLFMSVVEQRKQAGKKDTEGKTASPKPKDYEPIEYGKKVRAQLVGIEKDYTGAAYQLFSPIIDEYLLGHLFGDIFVRDLLTFKQRELVTISALAVLSGAESQLKFHTGAAMRVGNTQKELEEFVKVLEIKVDKQQAKIAGEILTEILKDKK